MQAREIISLFGGQTALAAALGKSQSTVSYWAKAGIIPAKWQPRLLNLAAERAIDLSAADFMVSNEKSLVTQKSNGSNELAQKIPRTLVRQQRQPALGIKHLCL